MTCAVGKCNADDKNCKGGDVNECILTTNCNKTNITDTAHKMTYDWTCGAMKNVVSYGAAMIAVYNLM